MLTAIENIKRIPVLIAEINEIKSALALIGKHIQPSGIRGIQADVRGELVEKMQKRKNELAELLVSEEKIMNIFIRLGELIEGELEKHDASTGKTITIPIEFHLDPTE